MAGSTVVLPLMTRETVARDTPATRATSSSVTEPLDGGFLFMT
jgi:hypothetical protein